MTDSRAEEKLRRHEQMVSLRAPWDTEWQKVQDRVLPSASNFSGKKAQGQRITDNIFDSTAPLALEKCAAAIHSLVSPDTQEGHKIVCSDRNLRDDQNVKKYYDLVTQINFAARRSSFANFSSQVNECYKSIAAFGNMGILTDDVVGKGMRYKSLHLSELYIAENQHGVTDLAHRRMELSARQAVEKFGYTQALLSRLPQKIKDGYEKHDEASRFEFIHVIEPNRKRKPGRLDSSGMNSYSCYVSVEGKQLVEEGGYRAFPIGFGRYSTNPRETYGRGPAMMVMAEINTLNEMEKTTLRAGQLAVNPPLLLSEDGALSRFSMRPNALNFGGVDDQGRQLVHPLQTGGNLPWALDMAEAKRKVINDAFLVTLFQILIDAPQITATEALLRAQEKGQLLAPTMGRLQSEFLGVIIERELDILMAAGALPPLPEELRDIGFDYEIEYTTPLSKLMKSEEPKSILTTFEQLAPWAQIDPSVYDIFDTEELPRLLAEYNGVPAKVLRSPEAVQQIKEQKAQAAQMQQILQAAPVAASAANSLAQAAATSAQIPQLGGVAQ